MTGLNKSGHGEVRERSRRGHSDWWNIQYVHLWTFGPHQSRLICTFGDSCPVTWVWPRCGFSNISRPGWWPVDSEWAKGKTNLPPHVTLISSMWPDDGGCWKTCTAHQTSGRSALRGFRGETQQLPDTYYIPIGKSSPIHYQILRAQLIISTEGPTRCRHFCNGIALCLSDCTNYCQCWSTWLETFILLHHIRRNSEMLEVIPPHSVFL